MIKKTHPFCDTADKMKFWCVFILRPQIVDQKYACITFSQNNTYVTLQKLTVDQILIVYLMFHDICIKEEITILSKRHIIQNINY